MFEGAGRCGVGSALTPPSPAWYMRSRGAGRQNRFRSRSDRRVSSKSPIPIGQLGYSCQPGCPGPGVQASERRVIQNVRGGISNFLHSQPNPTCFLVNALVAPAVGRLAHAGNQRQRTFQNPNHLAHRNVPWLPAERVPSAPSLLAQQETVPRQLEEDRFEEFPRKALLLSEFRCLHWTAS